MQSEDHRRTALQYPLFIGPYAAANNTALLVWRPSQGTKLYCLVNRGTLGVNNLPRVVARIMPRPELNPQPLDHESGALPLHHWATWVGFNLAKLTQVMCREEHLARKKVLFAAEDHSPVGEPNETVAGFRSCVT